MRKYRFFYHYFKQKKKMTVHFRGTCSVVDDIICNVSCNTKWKKTQPQLVMEGFCKEVVFEDGFAIIN